VIKSDVEKDFNMEDDMEGVGVYPWYLVMPQSTFKSIWSFCIIIFVSYIATVVPVRIAFEESTTQFWLYFDLSIDIFFFFDVIINFLSAYEDQNGDLVTDLKPIAKNYLKSWFVIDITSCIPISYI
jgi:hypothetical protein